MGPVDPAFAALGSEVFAFAGEIMDAGVGETLEGGRRGAKLTFIVTVVLILLAGAWIW